VQKVCAVDVVLGVDDWAVIECEADGSGLPDDTMLSAYRSRRPAARMSVCETRPSENGAIGPKES
jgi:hypothetical protein